MRTVIALLAVFSLVFGPVGSALAGIQVNSAGGGVNIPGAGNQILTSVLNDSGGTLTSGTVVIWDTDSGDPVDTGLGAFITTVSGADSNLVAGVVFSNEILDQAVGTICIYGPIHALWAASTDGGTDATGTALGTSTVTGEYGVGTGLGVALETGANSDSGGFGVNTNEADTKLMMIFVNPSNAE